MGFHFSQDETRRTVMTADTNEQSSAAPFYSGGTAAIASGGSWPTVPQGPPLPNPAWAAHSLPGASVAAEHGRRSAVLPAPPVAVVVPSGARPRAERAATPPPAPPAPSTQRTRNGRRPSRALNMQQRSRSPLPPGSAGPAVLESAPWTDAEEDDLGVRDVLTMVKRSFATVRGALTEQRAKTDDMARQVAAGMSKIDALAVALEQSMAAHAASQGTLMDINDRIQQIKDALNDGSGAQEPAAAVEDSFAWVPDLRKELLAILADDFSNAKSAWDICKPTEEHHAKLVVLLMESQGVSPDEATEMLRSRMPSRKRSGSKAPATVVVYRCIKRAVSHFYESLGKAAVKAFVSSVNESTGMGKQLPFKKSKTRTVLTLSPTDAAHLLEGDRFIGEAFCHKALLAGLANMVASIGAGHLLEEPAPGGGEPTMVCLLGHMAFVVVKVREHLKLRACEGPAGTYYGQLPGGINEGHREPWIRELVRLDSVYWRLSAPRNGLRLADATSSTRASPDRPAPPALTGLAGENAAAAAAPGGGGAAPQAVVGGGGAGYDAMVTQGGGLLEQLD